MSKLSLGEKLRLTTEKHISDATLHGVSKLVASDSSLIRKIFWAVIVLASLGYCVFSTYTYVSDFLNYEVVTKYEKVYESSPKFLTAEICHLNTSSADTTCLFNNQECVFSGESDGECIFFNADEKQKSKSKGSELGLRLNLVTLNTNPIKIKIYNYSISAGALKSMIVSRGMETDLVVSRVFQKKLGPPYTECKDKVQLSSISIPYLQSDCLELCQEKVMSETCGYSVQFKSYSELYYTNGDLFWNVITPLNNFCSLNKSSDFENAYVMMENQGIDTLCPECPVECNSLTYEISAYSTILADSGGRNFAAAGITRVNIYYESFEYTLISQTPKTQAIDLLGSIGGILGLFLGMSIMSFVELMELLFWLIVISCKHLYSLRTREKTPIKKNKVRQESVHVRDLEQD